MCGRELEFINEAFASNFVAPAGPMIDAFEQEFADLIGVPCRSRHAIPLRIMSTLCSATITG